MSTRMKKKPDELAYMIEMDDEKLRVRLTLISGMAMTSEMFLKALLTFVNDYRDNPEKVFQESIAMLDDEIH